MLGTNAPCPAFDPYGMPGKPVVCVDWCDAFSYCAWVGKRLCRDGSADELPEVSEWRLACGSGLPGIQHGELWEWQDDCSSSAYSARCMAFSSAGAEDASAASCSSRAMSFPRSDWAGNVGFRCCTD